MAKLRFPFQLWLDNRKLKAFEAVQLDQFETLTLKFYDNDLMTSIYLQNKKFDFFLLYQKIEKNNNGFTLVFKTEKILSWKIKIYLIIYLIKPL